MSLFTYSGRQRGFTLIEVVVAFAVFALCVGALYETLSGASRRSRQARADELGLLVAQSVLADARSRPPPWSANRSTGSTPGVSWSLEVEPYQLDVDPESAWQAFRIAVTVTRDGSTGRGITLQSIELAKVEP